MATPRSVSFLFQYRTASLEMQSKKEPRQARFFLSEIFLQLGAVPVRVVRRNLGRRRGGGRLLVPVSAQRVQDRQHEADQAGEDVTVASEGADQAERGEHDQDDAEHEADLRLLGLRAVFDADDADDQAENAGNIYSMK